MTDDQDTQARGDDRIALAIKYNDHQDFDAELIRDARSQLGLPAEGGWDEAAVCALVRLQEERGLDADGCVGEDTLALLESLWRGAAPARAPAAPRGPMSLEGSLDAAVAEAEVDWHAGTSEADLSSQGRLAAIFRDSGWSRFGVDKKPDGKPKDWCGMAVVSWLTRAGLDRDHRKTFWATSNVHACFTYCRRGSTHRTMKKVEVDGAWRLVEAWHAEKGSPRRWYDVNAIRATNLAQLDIRPGDVALINHHGKTDGAHHITMVRRWDGVVLETIEGNASGLGPDGAVRREAVCINRRDLSVPAQRRKVFGIGRLSALDFVDLDYK